MNKGKIMVLLWTMIGVIHFNRPAATMEPAKELTGAAMISDTLVIADVDAEASINAIDIQPKEMIMVSSPEDDSTVPDLYEGPTLSKAEIELIALVTMAEAEGECEEGKRLVIDTILNRVDSEHFPDTVEEVIYQPGHFTSMWNGRIDVCYVMDDIYQLVEEELVSRMNYDVMFFTAGDYGRYGDHMFPVGNHYFSSY